jgi:hypothetical protein
MAADRRSNARAAAIAAALFAVGFLAGTLSDRAQQRSDATAEDLSATAERTNATGDDFLLLDRNHGHAYVFSDHRWQPIKVPRLSERAERISALGISATDAASPLMPFALPRGATFAADDRLPTDVVDRLCGVVRGWNRSEGTLTIALDSEVAADLHPGDLIDIHGNANGALIMSVLVDRLDGVIVQTRFPHDGTLPRRAAIEAGDLVCHHIDQPQRPATAPCGLAKLDRLPISR